VRSYRNEKVSQLLLRFHRRKPIVPTCREQTDNGSEFTLEFEKATAKLSIQRYFSRVKTPKDNSEIERFNENLDYEWLIEYNFNRPHQSLAYLTPVEYIDKELAKIRSPVLPMWSARTNVCVSLLYMIEYFRGIHIKNAFIPILSYEIT